MSNDETTDNMNKEVAHSEDEKKTHTSRSKTRTSRSKSQTASRSPQKNKKESKSKSKKLGKSKNGRKMSTSSRSSSSPSPSRSRSPRPSKSKKIIAPENINYPDLILVQDREAILIVDQDQDPVDQEDMVIIDPIEILMKNPEIINILEKQEIYLQQIVY